MKNANELPLDRETAGKIAAAEEDVRRNILYAILQSPAAADMGELTLIRRANRVFSEYEQSMKMRLDEFNKKYPAL